MAIQEQYKFRRHDSIGATDATEDQTFLPSCFVDTGDLDTLIDCSNPKRLVLGRTGAGKTALLLRLSETEERVIWIQPESLALAHISNSTILNFLSQLGVKLDIFFRLLWRHVFTVEIIKKHFKINNESDNQRFFEWFSKFFKDRSDKQALEYLEKWGKSFWEETDYRTKEVTSKLEKDLTASLEPVSGLGPLSFEGSVKLSEEKKKEIVQRAQTIVNQVQIKELGQIINTLAKILNDPQKRYYIIIDRLDENWVDDKVRCALIRALIETVRDFKTVKHAKIIVAIRYDLLDRVYRLTRDSGFQEEKYESLYLDVKWSKSHLIQILNSRINFLIKKQYTKQQITYNDILPASINKMPIIDYIIERTMMRPRDIIVFFNYCIARAIDRPNISIDMIKDAERDYSRTRLRALADEWFGDYPNLLYFSSFLKNRKSSFSIDQISDNECGEFCLKTIDHPFTMTDVLNESAFQMADGLIKPFDFLRNYLEVFYRVGLIGLKIETHEPFSWSTSGRRSISTSEIHENVKVHIHPFAYRTLGIRNK